MKKIYLIFLAAINITTISITDEELTENKMRLLVKNYDAYNDTIKEKLIEISPHFYIK